MARILWVGARMPGNDEMTGLAKIFGSAEITMLPKGSVGKWLPNPMLTWRIRKMMDRFDEVVLAAPLTLEDIYYLCNHGLKPLRLLEGPEGEFVGVERIKSFRIKTKRMEVI